MNKKEKKTYYSRLGTVNERKLKGH